MNSKEILKDLVSFNTFNDQENSKIINYLETYLKKLGFETEYKSKCLVMKTRQEAKVGFLGHTDTVYGSGWTINPFELKEVDDKLYGLGTSDMKGGIASMLAAVSKIDWKKTKYGMKLIFTYDEEIGFSGINNFSIFWLWAIFQAKACSLPPLPSKSIFIYNFTIYNLQFGIYNLIISCNYSANHPWWWILRNKLQ